MKADEEKGEEKDRMNHRVLNCNGRQTETKKDLLSTHIVQNIVHNSSI